MKQTTTPAGTYDNASTGVFASHVILEGGSGAQTVTVKRVTLGGQDVFGAWDDANSVGLPDYLLDSAVTDLIEFQGGAGQDVLYVDYNGDGNPAPAGGVSAGGISFVGGTNDDQLVVLGIDDDNDDAEFASSSVTINEAVIDTSGVERRAFDGRAGLDELEVANGVYVTIAGVQELAGLVLNTSGTIDMGDWDMVIRDDAGLDYAGVRDLVASARNGGAWDGDGITSSAADVEAHEATTLGVLTGAQYMIAHDTSPFAGLSLDSSDVLVKYTWYGDADFDGEVNSVDYLRLDTGLIAGGAQPWFNGDFDLNNELNFDDIVLIDLGFNYQTGVMSFGGLSGWAQIAQMDHFQLAGYKDYLVDSMHDRGVYLTDEDFYTGIG